MVHRNLDNTHARCQSVLDVIEGRIVHDEFLFEVLAQATGIVPDATVLVARGERVMDPLLLSTHGTGRFEIVYY
jgi:hypothetical protein